jgi:hypothetical protein
LEIRGFNDALLKTPDRYRNHTVLEGMSLMPSESGSFPDLVGWHHGYLPAHLCHPSKRRDQKRLTAELITPLLTSAIEQNGVVPRSESGNGESPDCTPSEQEVKGKQDTRHNRVVRQLVIPAIWSAGAEALRQLEIAIGTRAASEGSKRLGDEKPNGADHFRSSRVALPVLPQRSPTEMRAKIQGQDVARPRPTMRPRTPARGMTIAHQPPTGSEQPTSTSSGDGPTPTVPRRRLINLMDFTSCETIAVGVLMLSMGLGFSQQLEDSPLSSLLKVVAVGAAVVAVIVAVILLWLGRRSAAGRS